jgi:hypothetical protein
MTSHDISMAFATLDKNKKSMIHFMISVTTLALGSRPRQKLERVQAKKGSPRITSHVPGSVRECEGMNPQLPSELPLWELEPQWTFESSKNDYRGQNPLDCQVPYIIQKLLERRCLKWARMTHLGD